MILFKAVTAQSKDVYHDSRLLLASEVTLVNVMVAVRLVVLWDWFPVKLTQLLERPSSHDHLVNA